MYYTTLAKIRDHDPCTDGWACLLRYLAKKQADDEPLSLATILEANGIDDAIWALQAVDGIDNLARIFAVRCVRQHCQHLLTDPRSLAALDVAELHAVGEATDEERNVARAAAWVAWAAVDRAEVVEWTVWTAVREEAWTAWATARDVVREATRTAGEAVWATARTTARDAAWATIEADFRAIFCA